MRTTIFDYLEFSLSAYNCVIIPDFGGFIINLDPASISFNGDINPPKKSIVFNPDLKHDDGILTSYISKNENISYNAASKKMKDVVLSLKSDIKSGKSIHCANLGKLVSNSDGNITFSSNKTVLFPAQYGLCPTEIRRLSVIETISVKEKRNISLKYTTTSIAAAVAAILLFIAPSGNIKDTNTGNATQKADFISGITTSLTSINIKNQISTPVSEDKKDVIIEPSIKKAPRTYYIIIGGEEAKNRADNLLDKIQKNSFPKAQMLATNDRYRIYISSFDDKTQAETFLDTFRKENPAFKTAWLYSKRNY